MKRRRFLTGLLITPAVMVLAASHRVEPRTMDDCPPGPGLIGDCYMLRGTYSQWERPGVPPGWIV